MAVLILRALRQRQNIKGNNEFKEILEQYGEIFYKVGDANALSFFFAILGLNAYFKEFSNETVEKDISNVDFNK